jgi:hypothetical protein
MSEPLPEGFSVVSDLEFAMLSHLPEFERRGGGLVRVDDPEQFVFPQSEWDRMERIRKEVEDSIAGQEQVTQDVAEQVQRATEAKPQKPPKADAKPYGVRLNRFGGFEPFGDN